MKRLLYSLVLFILWYGQANSQQPAEVLQKLRKLEFLEGKWDVATEIRLSAQGPWENSGGTSTIRKTLGSTIMEEDYSGTHLNKEYFTRALLAVNNMNLKYQLVFADSDHGVLIAYEGTETDSSFIFDRTWNYANGSSVQLRTVYTKISNNEFRIENMRMPQGATQWDMTGRKKYRRIQ